MKQEKIDLIRLWWSIDMINAVGNLKNKPIIFLSATQDWSKSGWVESVEDNVWQYIKVYDNGEIVYLITVQRLKFHKYFDDPIWVQFNPNHMQQEDYKQLDLVMRYVDHSHFTRADFALDIFNLAMQMYTFGLFGVTQEKLGRSGELETRYWGRRKSERQIRLYNKIIERKKHGKEDDIPAGVEEWWRLEFQFRQSKVDTWQDELVEKMQSFHVLAIDDNDEISEIDKAVIERVNADKFDFKNVSKDYAAKIRKMIRENVGFDTTVSEMAIKVFEKQKDELHTQLDNMLEKYNIGAQTAEMNAYFDAQMASTGSAADFRGIFDQIEQTKLEKNVLRHIILENRDKKDVSPEQ